MKKISHAEWSERNTVVKVMRYKTVNILTRILITIIHRLIQFCQSLENRVRA